jgi:putative tryptophan/tyrosine transport system substrate-binding protein
MTRMRRREFITLFGGAAAACPFAVRAQQAGVPVVGYLNIGAPEPNASFVAAFRKGLSEARYVEGRNVAIEYRWAHNNTDRLPELAADLVSRRVAVIVAAQGTAAVPAKSATATIPIVFNTAGDPVEIGLVASLNRPGGNITGVTTMGNEVAAKRLGLLHELLPKAARFAALFNPTSPYVDSLIAEARTAAVSIGGQLDVFTASAARDIETLFASLRQKPVDALMISPNILFQNRRVQLVTLATRHALPAIFPNREDAEIGGLTSYGSNSVDHNRLVGLYAGRILKGEKPADLPVMRASKFEFVINLITAKAFGIDVPPTLLALADEVIE